MENLTACLSISNLHPRMVFSCHSFAVNPRRHLFHLKPDFKFLEVAYLYVAKWLLTDPNPALRERLIQVLFKDRIFQWKRLENLIFLAKENVAKMSSNPALQVQSRQNSRGLQVDKKLDLTDSIKDGARMFMIDAGVRGQLVAFTEDSKLHIQEPVDVYRLVESDIDFPSVAVEVLREMHEEIIDFLATKIQMADFPDVTNDLMLSWSESVLSDRRRKHRR